MFLFCLSQPNVLALFIISRHIETITKSDESQSIKLGFIRLAGSTQLFHLRPIRKKTQSSVCWRPLDGAT